jgi:hypothetical protein
MFAKSRVSYPRAPSSIPVPITSGRVVHYVGPLRMPRPARRSLRASCVPARLPPRLGAGEALDTGIGGEARVSATDSA